MHHHDKLTETSNVKPIPIGSMLAGSDRDGFKPKEWSDIVVVDLNLAFSNYDGFGFTNTPSRATMHAQI